MYEARTYRAWTGSPGLDRFEVKIDSSDLLVQCEGDLRAVAKGLLARARGEVEAAIVRSPGYLDSLVPVEAPPGSGPVVSAMCDAGAAWGVGPMAAVAGAIAQAVGEGLRAFGEDVIVENGGDLYLCSRAPVTIALYTGARSPFGGKVAFEIDAARPIGVCTSSAVVGPSLSFGRADAVVAVASCAAFADAAATAIANTVTRGRDVDFVIEKERAAGRLDALIVCCEDRMGMFGDLELVPIGPLEERRGEKW